MTGDEILWWLQDLWQDILHLGDADIFSLVARLVLLVVVIVLGHQILRVVGRLLGDVFRPVINAILAVLRGIFWTLTAPIWLPIQWWHTWRGKRHDRHNRRKLEQQQNAQIASEEAERRRQAEVQEEEYQRMRALLSPLE